MNIKGIPVSNGIVIGKTYKIENEKGVIPEHKISDINKAMKQLNDAILKSETELIAIRDMTKEQIDETHSQIFDAHIEMLNDPELNAQVVEVIRTQNLHPAKAFSDISDQFINMFEALEDTYLKERAADIRDISQRVIGHLLGVKKQNLNEINEPVILVADDLTPSDTAHLNKDFIKGFITSIGGRTSHSAIMARTLEIPAVVGAKTIMDEVEHGEIIVLDAVEGNIILQPDESCINEYRLKQDRFLKEKERWSLLTNKPTQTICGHHVELAANIGSPKDIEGVLKNGAEGIGLYRTEFLYMDSEELPTEEEQYVAYKSVLHAMTGKPVVIRTLDIGGDKELKYMDMPRELNPCLGHRAIRLCFTQIELFKTQLRALLRASVHGNLRIMFPMIATLNEFRKAKKILEDVKLELLKKQIPVSDHFEVGIMVEIPSAALLADLFSKEVDFFSIGTNDLIQYTFAADRMNENVAYLYQPYNPSLLRLIKMVIDSAHKEGKWVGMCGEMAGDSLAIPILLGLGLDEFSVSAPSVLPVRDLISRLKQEDMKLLADKVLGMGSNEEVKAYVDRIVSS